MDYGIISLLLLQMAAVIGCAAAYIRIRAQTDGIKTARDNSAAEGVTIGLRIDGLARSLANQFNDLAKISGIVDDLYKKAGRKEATNELIDAEIETMQGAIRSIRASMAATARHSKREEPEDPPGVVATLSEDLLQLPKPKTRFGARAV